ncbi:MAG: neuraminidase-like domain-containing protein, partial [Terracidiphilus sp.]
MEIGLKTGSYGPQVARLHRVLTASGSEIEAGERERNEFGPSTEAAVRSLQRQHRLAENGCIDEPTLAVLIAIEERISVYIKEENISVTINEGTSSTKPKPADQHHGKVTGTLVNQDGAPIVGVRVELYAQSIRNSERLSEGKTGKQGDFSIRYRRPSALNLLLRAYDEAGNLIASSPTYFAAPVTIKINFTTATNGVVRQPSTYTALSSAVGAQLGTISLTSLQENSKSHELEFLANSVGAQFADVAYLYIAEGLGQRNQILPATFFGIFYEGIPASLDAALQSLPEAGLDPTFEAQVLSGVLSHSHDQLSLVLTDATSANVLPASYAAQQAAQLALLDTMRTTSVGNTPYVRGKTSLNDLLSAGSVASAVQTAFTQAYADNGGMLGPTWKTLRANKNLPAADLTALNTTLSLGELLTGNIPLVKDTLGRISTGSLAGIQNLALLDQNDWIARITEVDPDATSIPTVLPNETPQQKIARFALVLAGRFTSRYSTTAFAGGLTKATTTSFERSKEELVSFIVGNPKFNFKRTSIDHFVSSNKSNLSANAVADLKTAQRLFRVSPHFTTVDAMQTAGHTSAQSVYFQGRDNFIAAMTKPFGSGSLAKMAYARAQITYATALMAYSRYNGAFNGVNLAALGPSSPDPKLLDNLPDMQALFGSFDYFQCEDCQSIYSPAAYLVDLLQYLSWFPASGGGVSNARDAFLLRRPDVQYIALDCNNTNTTMPYIDLVNELLEAAIAPPSTPVTVIDTTGTSAERRALPQQISQAAYTLTSQAIFPLGLPFDLPFAQTTAYIGALGTTRAAVLSLFAGNPAPAVTVQTIAAASLGLNPEMQAVVVGNDGHQAWERWGFAQNPATVIDPGTRQPYSPNPADWTAALGKVPVLMNRSGLTLQQIYQLLEVMWVTQGSVTLEAGFITQSGVQILTANIDAMAFTGLTADVLDRTNRFLRLWTASGMQMWELDWAIEESAGGALDDNFLVFLAGAIQVRNQLNLPLQEVLSFWMPLETRDVTNHLGNEDTVTPSTYSEVFRNPAVLASASTIFVPVTESTVTGATNASPIAISTTEPHSYQTGQQVSISGIGGNTAANGTFSITVTGSTTFTLNGSTGNGNWTSGGTTTGVLVPNQIIISSSGTPTAEQNAITAALGLSGNEISAIITVSGASPDLTLPTLNALLQYQRLSTALSLSVSDLILWIQLTNYQPFTHNPADTLEFCRRLAVLQGTGLAVHDLDYLIRGQSASQSSLTFTLTAATAVLQAIGAAIAKLPTPKVIAVTGASNTSPIAITTALGNGLQTGAQVTISGIVGNTAANGSFTITTTSPTSFTLNGSAGNGAWISGGTITVTAYDNTTIQTIFVTALATATSTTANVVTPVLLKTNVLPLAPATISQLVNESAGVNPANFPTLINAFTTVAKAAALYTSLNPTETEFTFLVANAPLFNWLDPSALPLSPTSVSPYAQLECMLRALKLDQRQSARSPKLFDILTQWLPPNPLPATTAAAITGPVFDVSGATNAAPIAITTSAPHGLQTGAEVIIADVLGNLAANGTFGITVTSPSSFTLDGSTGSGAYTSGGTVSQPSLAFALNANVSDVLAIATALNATPPAFAPAAQTGSMVDIAMLTAIATALNVTTQYGISGAALVQLAAIPATAASATAAMGALQAQYAQSAWFSAIQPVEDTLRQNRRDALVAYMLGPGPAAPVPLLLNTDDIYNYYLIDPEMCPCALMTRLLQASLAIQQFVQQCFLNLSIGGVTVPMTDPRWDEWSWRQQYRLWQANREVFLYPENYVLPELRTNASPFFSTLESDMQSGSCDEDLAETALENYLRSLLSVANLQVVAHYDETRTAGSQTTYILHVFAKTSGTPAQWFYRTRTGMSPFSGSWSAWQQMNLDIASQQLLPVIWDQRLYLIWPIFKQISQKQSDQSVPSNGGGSQPAPQKFWSVEFAYSQLSAGEWQPKQMLAQKAYFATPDSVQAFTFRAYQDSNFNLQIQVYFVAIEEAIAQATELATINAIEESIQTIGSAIGAALGGTAINYELPMVFPGVYLGSIALVLLTWSGSEPQISTIFAFGTSSLVAQAALPMPESPLTIQEVGQLLPPGQLVDISQETTYPLITTANLGGYLPTPAGYGFSGQNMIYGNYTLGNAGSVPLNVLCVTSKNGQANSLQLLGTIKNPTVVVPFKEAVFDSTDPFFVYDPTRTYLVQPTYYTVSSSPQEITSLKYMNSWNTHFEFLTFYHPYARTFLREYEIGGVRQLMSRTLQNNPQAVRGWTPNFNFQTIYSPKPPVVTPYPGATGAMDPGESALDFAVGDSGAYSLYNWETFYHIPMFVASQLLQNQQFQDAITWLEYIFNPTDTSGGLTPQRFWEFAPFNAMNANDWANQQVQILLQSLSVDTSQGTQGIND